MDREGDAAATTLAQDFASVAFLLLSKCIWTKQVLKLRGRWPTREV
jgi:hypothetical protein